MIKLHLIFMIAVVSLFLLTIQLITLQLIVQKTKPNINHQLVIRTTV